MGDKRILEVLKNKEVLSFDELKDRLKDLNEIQDVLDMLGKLTDGPYSIKIEIGTYEENGGSVTIYPNNFKGGRDYFAIIWLDKALNIRKSYIDEPDWVILGYRSYENFIKREM